MGEYVIQSLLHYKYVLLIFIGFIEGPIISVAAGFLIRLGYMSFIPAYACLILGDLLGDMAWYHVGYFWGNRFVRKFGKFFSITDDRIATVKDIFHRHHERILFISKITMGFGFALVTLITAGLMRIPFRRYLAINLIGQFVWSGFLLALGFFFGNLYSNIGNIFGKIFSITLLAAALFGMFGVIKYIRTHVAREKLL